MNEQIRNLDYTKVLFCDIETVRGCNDFSAKHPHYNKWAWKQRDKVTNAFPSEEDVVKTYNERAALYPEWGKIVCISMGTIKQEDLVLTSLVGEEKEILHRFVEIVKGSGMSLCFHNSAFDMPYIRKRFFANGLTDYLSETQGNDVGVKPWILVETIIDTMALWKGSAFLQTSLDELAMVFNLPSSKDELHGNEVSDYFYNGRITEIKDYCERDVAVLANIIRCWKGDAPILEPKFKATPIFKPLSAIERIFKSGEVTEKDIAEIQALKLNKTDKKKALAIVSAAYKVKSTKGLPKEIANLFL